MLYPLWALSVDRPNNDLIPKLYIQPAIRAPEKLAVRRDEISRSVYTYLPLRLPGYFPLLRQAFKGQPPSCYNRVIALLEAERGSWGEQLPFLGSKQSLH
jgi:hypothetical protein